jgi:hypothetical protein
MVIWYSRLCQQRRVGGAAVAPMGALGALRGHHVG